MNKIIDDLEKLSKQIDDAKTRKAQLEGKREEQLKTLKSLGAKSVTEGKKLLGSIQAELSKLEKTIESKYNVLKEKYDW